MNTTGKVLSLLRCQTRLGRSCLSHLLELFWLFGCLIFFLIAALHNVFVNAVSRCNCSCVRTTACCRLAVTELTFPEKIETRRTSWGVSGDFGVTLLGGTYSSGGAERLLLQTRTRHLLLYCRKLRAKVLITRGWKKLFFQTIICFLFYAWV